MTYVPGYEWDIFVSFANNDNAAANVEDRWVSRFVEELKIGINTWLGNADQLKIFFEKDSIEANFDLDSLAQHAGRSALFIAILSPSYIRREWPLVELTGFRNGGTKSNRLFLIECRPVRGDAEFPEAIRSLRVTPFFTQDRDARAPRPLSPDIDSRDWMNRMSELTNDISAMLTKLKQAGAGAGANGAAVSITPMPTDDPRRRAVKRTVLLAQTTDEVAEQSDDVRRYLTQAGYTVLPGSGLYPQGGAQFKEAFRADLERADFYIQLLGQAKSRRDPELPEGYVRYQFEAAKAAAKARPQLKMFCWRPIYIDVATVTHEDAELLRDASVLAMTLETFKRDVQAAIEKYFQPGDHGSDLSGKMLTVYINAAPDDQEIASAVSDECSRNGFTTIMQPSENSAVELFKQVKASFGTCNAYFLVFGKADPLWAVRQGGYFSKISAQYSEAELPQVIAIIDGPPEGKDPPPIRLPRSRIIDCRRSLDPVRAVLAELNL